MIFFLFKVFKRLEGYLFGELITVLRRIGFGRIPGVRNLSSAICRLKEFFYGSMYDKVKPEGIVLTQIYGSRNKIFINADDTTIAPHLLVDGIWEKYKTELFKKAIRKGMWELTH